MTENEFMREMIKAAGGDPDKLPDRLKSTYYECLINCMNNGGGSGGSLPAGDSPHQMLVTDADGNTVWEERTHYSQTEIKEVDILPQTVIDENYALIEDGTILLTTPFILETGEIVTVSYNGKDYECSPFFVEEADMYAVGNVKAMIETRPGNDEPFIILASNGTDISGNLGIYGMLVPLDGATNITVSIRAVKEVETVKTIDKKYLPGGAEIIFTSVADGENKTFECNLAHDELWNMSETDIAKNTYIIDGEKRYSARGVAKETVSGYGNVIQVYADMFNATYELSGMYTRSIILSFIKNTTYNVTVCYAHYTYSISGDELDSGAEAYMPIFYSGSWRNGSVDFLEANHSNGYSLKTMSADTKGVAKAGAGLEVVDGVLSVVLTSPGGKRFNLSVDDNGTLSATEIT